MFILQTAADVINRAAFYAISQVVDMQKERGCVRFQR